MFLPFSEASLTMHCLTVADLSSEFYRYIWSREVSKINTDMNIIPHLTKYTRSIFSPRDVFWRMMYSLCKAWILPHSEMFWMKTHEHMTLYESKGSQGIFHIAQKRDKGSSINMVLVTFGILTRLSPVVWKWYAEAWPLPPVQHSLLLCHWCDLYMCIHGCTCVHVPCVWVVCFHVVCTRLCVHTYMRMCAYL